MDQLEKKQLINESSLSQRDYFQSLFQEACRTGLLSASQIERIQLELVELMGKETERYTNDESSSIPVEKAQEILQSITYIIGGFLKTTTDMTQKISILKTDRISALFYKGMDEISACKTKAEGMLKHLQKDCLKLNNIAYQDTIFEGLPDFFHNYNIEFGAHEIPASFDYPLFTAIDEYSLLGIEYINEYLFCITIEDRFLKHFATQTINRLLEGFDKESEHILINIFELVLINALGCALLSQKVTKLDITEKDISWLQNCLGNLEKKELEHKLESAFIEMDQELFLEAEVSAYIKAAVGKLAGRLRINLQTKTLDKLFISFRKAPEAETVFEDGTPMEDEKLRDLIEQLWSCSRTSDKIELMKMHISSMADFSELIEECFYEEDYEEVFHSLSDNERAILLEILKLEAGLEYDEYYEPPKLWQKKFLQFGNTKK